MAKGRCEFNSWVGPLGSSTNFVVLYEVLCLVCIFVGDFLFKMATLSLKQRHVNPLFEKVVTMTRESTLDL